MGVFDELGTGGGKKVFFEVREKCIGGSFESDGLRTFGFGRGDAGGEYWLCT